jgi:dethiobiotin synthetase
MPVTENPAPVRGLFVTGTGTEVGKTVLTAAICASLADRGERVAAFKPAVTGLDETAGEWPRDHELLAACASAGQQPGDVAPYRFGPAVSPHYAAELGGERVDPGHVLSAARAAADGADALVCEGVGGWLVPLADDYLVRDLAAELGLPVVIAARTGLGTINHTLLTVEAVRAAGLEVAGVVMTPWPNEPEPIERSNRDTVARLAGVDVHGLPPATPDPSELASAAEGLPLDRWIDPA